MDKKEDNRFPIGVNIRFRGTVEDSQDICNICGKPFLQNEDGEWINHGHTPTPQKVALKNKQD